MGERENEALARRAAEAWNANDWETLERLNAPDLVVNAPAGWPEAGTLVGWPAARRQFERLKDSWSDEHAEITQIESAGDQVLVATRWLGKGQSSGLDLDLGIWVVYTIRDGVMVRHQYFLDEAEARRASRIRAESPG
jgi:ketosteroid isomerase-like protein